MIMVFINEAVRTKVVEKPYAAFGITAMNSAEYMPEKCSWVCHNDTAYCKARHVKYLGSYFAATDRLYFGVIAALAATGNYGAANIVFLVLLFPLTILYFIIKSLNAQDEIRKLLK